jgi:hypothetical protein
MGIEMYNQMTEQAFGYPCFGYQYFFISDEGAKLVEENVGLSDSS